MDLHLVLIEPEIPQNTGNIARTCAALGATLDLIEPLGFSLEDRYLRRAGLDYWPLVRFEVYPNFEEFLAVHGSSNVYFTSRRGNLLYTGIRYPDPCYFVFGKESSGLSPDILERFPDRIIRIPTRKEARSLNLSNTAAILAYTYACQQGFPGLEL